LQLEVSIAARRAARIRTHRSAGRVALRRGAAAAATAAAARALPAAAAGGAAVAVDRVSLGPTISNGKAGKNYALYEDTINGPRGSRKVVNIAFEYPRLWSSLKNSVDLIDGKTGTVATVVAAPLPDAAALDSKAFYACIFSPDGKIQRAGTPVDEFKILGVRDGAGGAREVDIKFTAVSPNSRLIDRRAVATATAVGDTAYIFVVSAAAVKWKEERDTVETVARTFKASF
jgi:hypothetical protein